MFEWADDIIGLKTILGFDMGGWRSRGMDEFGLISAAGAARGAEG